MTLEEGIVTGTGIGLETLIGDSFVSLCGAVRVMDFSNNKCVIPLSAN